MEHFIAFVSRIFFAKSLNNHALEICVSFRLEPLVCVVCDHGFKWSLLDRINLML